MPLTYHKGKAVLLRDTGHDELWLQQRILEDPSILGLGDVSVIERERRQAPGGRIDFLMSDPDTNTLYEVEVMLGRLDESHIIRTIEYWDIERRRRPEREHRAVIVAEEITNRFFNVISLLNRSVPIIAIQLGALQLEEKIILSFTKVLDVYEPPEDDEEEQAEPADRQYWEQRSNPESLKIVDRCVALVKSGAAEPRITYNRYHIAMGTNRQNFCWFHPRKVKSQGHFDLRTGEANQAEAITKLEEAGIYVRPHRKDKVRVIVTPRELSQHEALIREILHKAANEVGGF